MDFNIPTEVRDKSAFQQLKKADRQIVAYAVLFGVGNQEAFKLYHPEYLTADGKLNDAGRKASSMFWNYGKVKDYREQYEKELAEFLGRKSAPKSEIAGEIDESRKDKVLKELLSQAMSLVEKGDLDPDTMKTVVEVFRKLNILKDEVERIIAPIRVLMARCSACRYRIGVESAVCNGEILDMCAYCKCRKMAEEHGYRFNDGKDLLEIPQEIIADLESKNDVKLMDILDGKIDN